MIDNYASWWQSWWQIPLLVISVPCLLIGAGLIFVSTFIMYGPRQAAEDCRDLF